MSDIKLTKDGIAYEPIEPTYTGDVIGVVFGGKTHWFKPVKKEKDIHKDWEVLTYSKRENEIEEIFSVKRISDNEIFTVGDKVEAREGEYCSWENIYKVISMSIKTGLLAFEIMNIQETNPTGSIWREIGNIQKVKPKEPLFTIDGLNIFEGDEYFTVNLYSYEIRKDIAKRFFGIGSADEKSFLTNEKAKEYILLNKPILISYFNIECIIEKSIDGNTNINHFIRLFNINIKDFFKSKINL